MGPRNYQGLPGITLRSVVVKPDRGVVRTRPAPEDIVLHNKYNKTRIPI